MQHKFKEEIILILVIPYLPITLAAHKYCYNPSITLNTYSTRLDDSSFLLRSYLVWNTFQATLILSFHIIILTTLVTHLPKEIINSESFTPLPSGTARMKPVCLTPSLIQSLLLIYPLILTLIHQRFTKFFLFPRCWAGTGDIATKKQTCFIC